MKPTLIVNPTDDVVFADFAQTLVDHGAASTDELERRLRAEYPRSTVHARELVGESAVIWYVYRDGRWIVSHPAGEELEGHRARCVTDEPTSGRPSNRSSATPSA